MSRSGLMHPRRDMRSSNENVQLLGGNFYGRIKFSARIKFSPRMPSRFCFPAGFSPGSWTRVFFSTGSRRVQISRRDSCRDTRREFFPGRIPLGKRATSAGSQRDPGERRESRRDPSEIPVPILQGKLRNGVHNFV